MRVKLEKSTSAIELYSGIANSARKSLQEWANIADGTSRNTQDNNITLSNNEQVLSDERITEIYKTLSDLRKRAQVLVLCCRPDKEKLEGIEQLSKIFSQLKEETESFPPVDSLKLRFNHTQNVIENARRDVVLNERRHRNHRNNEQSQSSDSE